MLSSSGMADVGACHTVDTWRHVRGFTMFAWYGKCRAHNTVDAQRHLGEPCRMGVNGAHNTVGENIGAYNTAWVLLCQGSRRALFLQVYRVWSLVLWFDLCALPYFLRPFPSPYRAGISDR